MPQTITTGTCPKHGDSDHVLYNMPSGTRVRCHICVKERGRNTVLRNKQRLLDLVASGGVCGRCGYNKNKEALHFHHIDPSTKDFNISRRLKENWVNLVNEASKCIVLCANCHAEVESGENLFPEYLIKD